MKQTLNEFKIYVIPSWIYKEIIRNKLNIVDIGNYKAIRNILSLHDIAEWKYLNDTYTLDGHRISNEQLFTNSIEGLKFLDISISQELKDEAYANVFPLSETQEVKDSCLNRNNPYSDYLYKFIPYTNNVLYIIVSENFNIILNDRDFLDNDKIAFVKEYVQNCDKLISAANVSKLPLFELYLKHLAFR